MELEQCVPHSLLPSLADACAPQPHAGSREETCGTGDGQGRDARAADRVPRGRTGGDESAEVEYDGSRVPCALVRTNRGGDRRRTKGVQRGTCAGGGGGAVRYEELDDGSGDDLWSVRRSRYSAVSSTPDATTTSATHASPTPHLVHRQQRTFRSQRATRQGVSSARLVPHTRRKNTPTTGYFEYIAPLVGRVASERQEVEQATRGGRLCTHQVAKSRARFRAAPVRSYRVVVSFSAFVLTRTFVASCRSLDVINELADL